MRCLIGAILMTATPAAADLLPWPALEGWYGKVGVETGAVVARTGADDRGAAPLLGMVGTWVHINEHAEWVGIQGDFLLDWGGAARLGTRWSFGPELGVSVYGLDVGYHGERDDTGTRHGIQVRAKVTVGVAAIYVRSAFTAPARSLHPAPGAADDGGRGGGRFGRVGAGSSIDVGLQLKLPALVRRARRRPAAVASAHTGSGSAVTSGPWKAASGSGS
jgi:hypothetical protein